MKQIASYLERCEFKMKNFDNEKDKITFKENI